MRVSFRQTVSCLLLLSVMALAQSEPIPADPPLCYWKGNIHTHSLWSDGNDFPEMIAEWYQSHDYNFLSFSDHNILSRGQKWVTRRLITNRIGLGAYEKYVKRFGKEWVETRGDATDDKKHEVRLKPLGEFRALVEVRNEFILLQGEEITDRFEKHQIHMNATNIAELIAPQGGKSVRDVMTRNLEAVRKQEERTGQPVLAHLNHPNFQYSITAEDIAAVVNERFFEVQNGHPGTHTEGDATHASTERLWDIANTIRLAHMKAKPLFGLATDDSHHYHGKSARSYSRQGRGWIMVRARHLTPESLVRAMREGDFYSSSGVELASVEFDGRYLNVAVQPQEGITYTIEFIGTMEGFDASSTERKDAKGNVVTRAYSEDVGRVLKETKGISASYRLTGRELYVRAVVTSSSPATDPSYPGEVMKAWTQPVGWRTHIQKK